MEGEESPEELGQSQEMQERQVAMERALKFVNSRRWIFAKTYAQTTPHEYCLLKNCAPNDVAEWDWFLRFMEKYSYPEKFYTKTFYYINIGPHKYWHMDPVGTRADLINRADAKISYRSEEKK